MKLIGLIGGMSWESTAVYYRLMNEMVKQQLGGLHSARLIVWSFDFEDIASLQAAGKWETAAKKMTEAGQSLKAAGAEALVICTNTMHKMAAEVEEKAQLPVLHIADATAIAIQAKGLRKVALLATRFTMEQEFYKGRLREKHGLEVLVPSEEERVRVHSIIYDELCKGIINPESKDYYSGVIASLVQSGCEGVILGCTEIGLLVQQKDVVIPVFDTTSLHAAAAVKFALS